MYIKEGTPEEVARKSAALINAACDGTLVPWVQDEHGNQGQLRDYKWGVDKGLTPVRVVGIGQGFALVIGSQKEDPDPKKHIISRAQVAGNEAVKLLLVEGTTTYEVDLPWSEEGGGRANPHEIESVAICIPIIIEAKVKTLANIMYGQHWDAT